MAILWSKQQSRLDMNWDIVQDTLWYSEMFLINQSSAS